MSVVRLAGNVGRLAWRGAKTVKAFFVRWFLPLPAVDSLDDHDRWAFDDDEEDGGQKQLPGRDVEHAPAQIVEPLPPAPEVRAPEGAEERQSRQPNMPNPFA